FLDHYSSRQEERASRESSKQGRILARVLPTKVRDQVQVYSSYQFTSSDIWAVKVTIVAPTDTQEQARWRKQIEKDVETLKLESNHLLIRRVLDRSSIDAAAL